MTPPEPESEPRPEGARAAGACAVALVSLAVIGWIDFATGEEIGFSLFYLLPVVGCGWQIGPRAALAAAAVATLCWLGADLAYRPPERVPVTLWNGFTRLVIFLGLGLAASRVRGDRDRMASLLDREASIARSDALTGLANSRSFLESLGAEVARSQRAGTSLCLAYLDLDNFKAVNDGFGHSAGDDALRRVGAALRASIRATDVAARLGGDEFAVLFWSTPREAVEDVTRRLVEQVEAIGREYPGSGLGVSVGVAFFATPPATPDEALRQADAAMYEAKEGGKGRAVIRG